MTNLEALQNAKTEKDFFEILVEYETDMRFYGGFDTHKWLKQERNTPAETTLKGFIVISRRSKND